MPLTKEDRIKTVYGGGGHVVILGAGASIAATKRNPVENGKILPSMDNFIEILSLSDLVRKLPSKLQEKNFEALYSKLFSNDSSSKFLLEIESKVYKYFKEMSLPNSATIYDYLVLSLRPKDIIATFNWDPFLFQAWNRNYHIADPPYLAFLHGSVSIGYCKEDKTFGPAGMTSKRTNSYYSPTKLLYPIGQKNYSEDEFIAGQWEMLNSFLSDDAVKRVTIFGYGAPESDTEAVSLLNRTWKQVGDRDIEQFEIIDVVEGKVAYNRWKKFIHSNHYDYINSYFDSSLAMNPRRTFESYHQHNFPITEDETWSESNPVPKDITSLHDLWAWHKPLIDAENEWKKQNLTG